MGAENVKRMLRLLTIVLGVFSILWLIGSRTNHLMFVSGTSMYPTIKSGNLLVLEKQESYNVNDIVVFKNGGENYVKRIVATGDYYYFTRVYPDESSYLLMPKNYDLSKLSKKVKFSLLGDRFWMKGDGYGSVNSEDYGPIEKGQILGKVKWIIRT
jgi:hypothetical protein